MSSSKKLLRLIGSHLIALILGAGITFGAIKVMSSQAQPILEPTPKTEIPSTELKPEEKVALEPNAQDQLESFVTKAVNLTGSSVVRIDTERTIVRRIPDPFDDPFFRELFPRNIPLPREEERQIRGQGSGFITDKSGIILTNAHVVNKADKVTVTLTDGREFEGVVKGTDEVTDLAVVKIEPQGQDLPVARLGDSSIMEVGDWAIAVGNPVGLNNTVTLGIISTISRPSFQVGIPDKRIDFLQTDAAINPGNSGGPLLNARGEVIGINTAIRPDAMGIGFAIPINKAKELQPLLAKGKKVPHPYIGIQMITLTPELAAQNNRDPNSLFLLPEIEGVLVVKVVPNSPAEKAGIRRGDVIVEINGQKITDAGQLQLAVEKAGVNRTLKMKIRRGEQVVTLNVTTAQLQEIS